METILQTAESLAMKLGIHHRSAAGLIALAMVAVTGFAQPPTKQKAKGEKPTSCGYSRFGHHDDRRILSNHSTCGAGPISPMRQTVIRAADRFPL